MRSSARRFVPLVLCIASVFGGASNVHANAVPWMGEMTLDLGRFGKITQGISGVAMVGADLSGNINTMKLDVNTSVMGTLTIPSADPDLISAHSVMVDATLGTGTLRGFSNPGGLANPGTGMVRFNSFPMMGMARFCFLANCPDPRTVPFSDGSSIGVGVGGMITNGITTTVMLSATGWQTSTAILTTSTVTSTFAAMQTLSVSAFAPAFIHGVTSEAQLSLNPGQGLLQMVTPTQVSATGPAGKTEKIAMFTTLTIQFIPEPGKLLGSLSGIAAVALLAVSRRRSRDRSKLGRNRQ